MSHRGSHEHRPTNLAFAQASRVGSDRDALRELNVRHGGLFVAVLVVAGLMPALFSLMPA